MASLTTREYAALHGVSTGTVLRWINEFLIYAEKTGNRYSIPEDEPPPPFEDEFTEREEGVTDDFGSEDLEDEPDGEPLVAPSEDEETEEEGEAEDQEEEEEPCRDPSEFDKKDLRAIKATREAAEDYAGDIPVPTLVFKRCSDGLFQTVIQY